MAKIVFQILILILSTVFCKGQEFTNTVDSLGYKQGEWIEYKVLPTSIEKGGRATYSADSSIVYLEDLYLYEGECLLEKQIGNYINSLRYGLWTLYWPSGNLKGHLNYSHGIPIGEFCLYYENGIPALKGIISYDLNSKWETYDENGKLIRVLEGSPKKLIESLGR